MTKKMWGGRFKTRTAGLTEKYTVSVGWDKKLYAQDIAGSVAHARMLARQGVLTAEEAEQLVAGLTRVKAEIEAGSFVWRDDMEDVHMNIESRLTEIVGPVGGKLHTGRSRNDQVCLDFRLFVSDRLSVWSGLLHGLIEVLTCRAEEHVATLMPGYTHLQPAQPVSLAHHLMAFAQMFRRDFDRLADAAKRVRVSPLGAAALAGTTYPLDPASVAAELGFEGVFANSMDAVSDRDFVAETLFAAGLIMAHLSRLSEELIIWSNPAFGFVAMPDGFATGSSIMPQKKNPDVAEIMRGKVGRVYGDLTAILTTIKGLPLTYNRDLQEDKLPFFDTDETVSLSLEIMAAMLAEVRFRPENMRKALAAGFLNATELADYLVGKGVAFREAHHITGAAVAFAEDNSCGLEDLTLDELRQFSDLIDEDVFVVLAYETAVKRRETPGGTGPRAVAAQIETMKAWLETA